MMSQLVIWVLIPLGIRIGIEMNYQELTEIVQKACADMGGVNPQFIDMQLMSRVSAMVAEKSLMAAESNIKLLKEEVMALEGILANARALSSVYTQ